MFIPKSSHEKLKQQTSCHSKDVNKQARHPQDCQIWTLNKIQYLTKPVNVVKNNIFSIAVNYYKMEVISILLDSQSILQPMTQHSLKT